MQGILYICKIYMNELKEGVTIFKLVKVFTITALLFHIFLSP